MSKLLAAPLRATLRQDVVRLRQTHLPIITISATFREDIKGWYGLTEDETIPDVVFSRAHFSMALAIALTAWQGEMDAVKAWMVDPTNYVSPDQWRSIIVSEVLGKTIARHPLLALAKSAFDKFGRQKLPIANSITPPLLHLIEHVDQPLLSLHVAAGNIAAQAGKTVLQVITDPHVRSDYLVMANSPNFYYAVFDEQTKQDLLEKAFLIDKPVDPARIFVTGSPIDPRIVTAGKHKQPWRSGPLRLCLTTGGLGTNKNEILELLDHLLPELQESARAKSELQLLVYAGTQADIANSVRTKIESAGLNLGPLADDSAQLRLIHHPQILDANELLIKYGFPWAHGFITKPSGDMAYDAAAAGCFILTLAEWGEWEHAIRVIFERENVARRAIVDDIAAQLVQLRQASLRGQSWIEQAMHATHKLDPLFTSGSQNIIAAYHKVVQKSGR